MTVSLRDLLPLTEEVTIRNERKLVVYGVGTKQINKVLNRFTELRKAFVEQSKSMNVMEVASFTPTLLAAICAQGLVKPDKNDDARDVEVARLEEEVGEILVVGEQIDVALKVFDLSFPRGVGPFMKVLRQLGLVAGDAAPIEASGDTGKAQDTSSQSSSTT